MSSPPKKKRISERVVQRQSSINLPEKPRRTIPKIRDDIWDRRTQRRMALRQYPRRRIPVNLGYPRIALGHRQMRAARLLKSSRDILRNREKQRLQNQQLSPIRGHQISERPEPQFVEDFDYMRIEPISGMGPHDRMESALSRVESDQTQGYGIRSQMRRHPIQPQTVRTQSQVVSSMGSSRQGFNVPPMRVEPLREQRPQWREPNWETPINPFGEDIEDDPALDYRIQRMKDDLTTSSSDESILPKVVRMSQRILEEVQNIMDESDGRQERQKQTLRQKGYKRSGDTFVSKQRQKEVGQLTQRPPFIQRPRTLPEIRKYIHDLCRREESLGYTPGMPRTILGSPLDRAYNLRERSLELLRSRPPKRPRERDPRFDRMIAKGKKDRKEWKGMRDRRVYQKSKYKVSDINRAKADDYFYGKRTFLSRGDTYAPKFKRRPKPVVPTLKDFPLSNIEEGMEQDEGQSSTYFPSRFEGYPFAHRRGRWPLTQPSPSRSAYSPTSSVSSIPTQTASESSTIFIGESPTTNEESDQQSGPSRPHHQRSSERLPFTRHYETEDDSDIED